MVAQAFNLSSWVVEAGGFLSVSPVWYVEYDAGQPGLHRETLSLKHKNKQENKETKTKQNHKLKVFCRK